MITKQPLDVIYCILSFCSKRDVHRFRCANKKCRDITTLIAPYCRGRWQRKGVKRVYITGFSEECITKLIHCDYGDDEFQQLWNELTTPPGKNWKGMIGHIEE